MMLQDQSVLGVEGSSYTQKTSHNMTQPLPKARSISERNTDDAQVQARFVWLETGSCLGSATFLFAFTTVFGILFQDVSL